MANQPTVLSTEQRFQQAAFGGQGPIRIAAVPAGGNAGLIGTNLVDAGELTVLGVYRCLIPLTGLVSGVSVFLKATFASGTVTSDLDSLYWVRTPTDTSTWTKKTAGSNDGAMSSTVLQTSTLTPSGEQYAVLDITLGTAAACTFTVGEYCGL